MNQLQLTYFRFTCLFLISFVLFTFSGNATKYYVSSTGNDANPGTSEDLPWQSLTKVNSFFKLYPSDQILFKRGDSWNGTIAVRTSGTAGSPIVYGAYGTGDKPKIYGSEKITGWTLHSGKIYKASVDKTDIKQLFLNGSRMKIARYPDEGYFPITAANSTTQFASTSLDGGINYTGATCILRNNAYTMYAREVRSSSSQTINLTSAPVYPLVAGYGFWLTNKLDFLTQAGEWYYDNAANILYFWSPKGDSPSNYEIRVSTLNYGVYISKQNYITVKDLEILHSGVDGFKIAGSDYTTIDNCNILYSDLNGVSFTDYACDYSTVKNCTIHGSNSKGIISFAHNAIIIDNTIEETGQLENINKVADGMIGIGIFSRYDNSVIEYNRIINCGYSGINFNGLNSKIKYNYINGACQTLDDGGGIYTYSGGTYPNNTKAVGSIIENNIVLNCYGQSLGKTNSHTMSTGIYLDNSTKGVTATNNTVSGVQTGLYVKGGQNVLSFNTVYDAAIVVRAMDIEEDSEINNNIFYQSNRLTTYTWWPTTPQYGRMFREEGGSLNYNYNKYFAHYEPTILFFTNGGNRTFTEWQSIYNNDVNGSFNSDPLTTGETEKLFYNETKQTKIFYLGNSVYRDVYGKQLKDTFSLKPFTSKILIGKNFDQINQKPEIKDQSFNFISPKIRNYMIGQILANDPDTGQNICFSVIQGNESGFFMIDSITGIIHANNDIQTSKDISFSLIIQVRDDSPNALSDTAWVAIHITGTDISPPEIISFSIPSEAISLTVQINDFITTDDVGVTNYSLTEFNNPASAEDSAWSATAPLDYTFSKEGSHVLYAWAKDSAGNISVSVSDTVIIMLPDLSPTYSEYLFEEADSVNVFDSKGSNHGKIINNALRVNGVPGIGISFSGSGYINLGKSFGENVQDEITLSAWINPASSDSSYQGIIMHGGPSGETYALYIHPDSKGIVFITNGTSNARLGIENIDELWDGNWHHLTVTYNGAEKVIYLDNVALIKAVASGKIESGWKYNLFIGTGSDEDFPSHLYEGLIDEVRIYNYALTPDEIGELYHSVNKEIKRIYTTEYISICEGEVYLGWTETGQYEQVLQRILPSASGADSIVTTNLQVNPVYNNTDKAAVCEGETYIFGAQSLKATGEYTELFMTDNGCDSTEILMLTVNPEYNITEEVTISDTDDYLGWTNEGTYLRNLISSSGCDSVVVTNLKVVQSLTQFIDLEKGWNIFSSYVVPDDNNLEALLKNLKKNGTLIKVQDENDNKYEALEPQSEWYNQIGKLNATEGYQILVESDCVLEFQGRKVELPLNIEINKGMNIISFPTDVSTDAMNILQPLIDNGIIEKVQDEKGRAIENWAEMGWINGIGDFNPGKGYILHANKNGLFTLHEQQEKYGQFQFEELKTTFFRINYEGNGLAHMNINITGLNDAELGTGDEIAVFDKNICVGAVKLNKRHIDSNRVSIPASASDESKTNGFAEGQPAELRAWIMKTGETVNLLPEILTGKMVFNRHASIFLKLKRIGNPEDNINIFPNPAKTLINIHISILPKDGAKIILLDVTGKQILIHEVQSNSEIIPIEYIPSGIYFVKILLNDKYKICKLIIT